MKTKTFFILCAMAIFAFTSCKTTSKVAQANDEIFMVTETLPEFPGGTDQMMSFLASNVVYPSSVGNEKAVVPVRFVVEKDGSLTGFEVMKVANRTNNPAFESAALEALKKMPMWKPATNGGKPVRCYMTVPIRFSR